ncbi:hypothetical protein LWI29_011755 [Acer saccharum]|uniref:Pentatricopeptide repeat-containing protein n=1 Tax=Acer saccharum TaxID=4024 RepID=A0AA39VXI1_ACESA|nr:hypothetical protein LWI29_011755 [Acer saccharum]
MWVSTVKLSFSQRHFIKHVQCIRFRTVSAVANLNLVSSDSDVDGQNVNSECELQGNGFSLELSTNEVLETLNGLRKKPKEALSFFQKLKTIGFSHDFYTYAAIVRILCHCGWDRRFDSMVLELVRKENELDFEVTDLFEALSDEGSNALVRFCDALVKAYVSVGMFDKAIDVLLQIKRRGFALSILSCNYFMNLLIECGKVDIALAFYQQLKRLGLSSNEFTYVLVIKALCRKGCLEEAVEVFQEADEAGVTINAFAYSTYIEGLCNNGRLDLGYQMLQALQAANIPLGVFAYTVVIRGFCNENRLEEAEHLLRDMEKHEVLPDVHVYSALIHGNCKFGSIMKALDLNDEMESKGIKTNCVIVSFILKCLCRMGLASQAVDQFMKSKDTRVYLDKVCYNIAMEALCKLEKVEVAVELFNEMKNKQMAIDVVNYTTVIKGYCLQEKIVQAFNLFLEMKGAGLEPDLVTYNTLAGEFARCGLVQEVYYLLDDMKTQCLKPDAVVHKMIIEGFCIGGKVKEAEAFLDSLQEKCLENYSAMFNGYFKANHLIRAFKLFMNLSKQGILTVNGCKQHNIFYMEGDKEKAVMLLETMISKLIGRLCQAGETEKARMVFNVFSDIGFTPDLYTYTMMINAYCKKSRLHEARDLFNDMKQRGIKPDVVTYTVLFDAHSKIDLERSYSPPNALQSEEKVVDASVFLSEMEEMDIRPDLVCYTALLARYCKTKNLKGAVEVFNEITDRGLKPDVVTYTVLISFYCAMGDFYSGKIIFDEMLAKEIQPDEHALALHRQCQDCVLLLLCQLLRVFDPVSYSHLVRDKFGSNLEKDVVDQISSSSGLGHSVASIGSELDWIEPASFPSSKRMLLPYGYDRVYDAFHLLQTEPSIQVVRELKESFNAAESNGSEIERSDETCDDSNPAMDIVKWIFNNTKAKAVEVIEKITNIVTELFKPPGDEKATNGAATAGATDSFEEKLRTSFLLILTN